MVNSYKLTRRRFLQGLSALAGSAVIPAGAVELMADQPLPAPLVSGWFRPAHNLIWMWGECPEADVPVPFPLQVSRVLTAMAAPLQGGVPVMINHVSDIDVATTAPALWLVYAYVESYQ